MARIPLSIIVGFILPIILLVINLVFHLGGILVLILLVMWIGLGVFLITPEDRGTP